MVSIKEFKKLFRAWQQENQKIAITLKGEMLRAAGLEELGGGEIIYEWDKSVADYSLVKIPLEKLSFFGTACGSTGNRPFSQKVLDFLKSKGFDFILATVEDKTLEISSAAIHATEKSGVKLEKMIEENAGSLRCDGSKVGGWTVYESE